MSRENIKGLKDVLLIVVEWSAIIPAMLVIPFLSRRLLYVLADVISRVFYRFDRRGKRRALENLRILAGKRKGQKQPWLFDPDAAAFDPSSAEDIILRRSYRNMVRTVLYAFWTCRKAEERARGTGVMSEACRRFLAEHKTAITVSGHIGCWEILSQLALLEGHRMMSVAKNIGTRGMTALLMKARKSIGQEIVPAEGAFKVLMNGLKEGRSLGLLVDQTVSPKRGGVWVRFLDRAMSVSAAPAFFAAKGKVPIVIAWSRPMKDGRYRCEMIESIRADEARDIRATTQRCTKALERIVRRHPSCWVLNYNFFSCRPKEADVKHLPPAEGR